MYNLILKRIDNVILAIKKKYDSNCITAPDIFIIFAFEILRCEISLKRISENTISAIKEIGSTTSHYYYYRDYSSLYNDIQNLYTEICKLDNRFTDVDFESSINFELHTWSKYLSESSSLLLKDLPMSYFSKKE